MTIHARILADDAQSGASAARWTRRYVSPVPAELAAIGIVTDDVAEAVRFYRMLGVDVPEPDGGHLEATLPSGLRLMWDTVDVIRSFDPEWTTPVGQRIGLAFECTSASDVDAVFAMLVDAGFRAKKEPWDAVWGQRYAQVYDPDGNAVDLFAPLE